MFSSNQTLRSFLRPLHAGLDRLLKELSSALDRLGITLVQFGKGLRSGSYPSPESAQFWIGYIIQNVKILKMALSLCHCLLEQCSALFARKLVRSLIKILLFVSMELAYQHLYPTLFRVEGTVSPHNITS
jgi:hypothetical protein